MRRAQELTPQRFHHEPPALTSDMTRSELAEALEHLPMRRDRCLVELDRDVRDYLLTMLKRRD